MQRKVLGKGLKALFQETATPAEGGPAPTRGVIHLPVDKIHPNPDQPRTRFEPETIEELGRSIQKKGLIQPVVVFESNGEYFLVAGERRLRAVKTLGMPTIPAIVRETERTDLLELALIENIQREDLNPMEEAAAYKKLMDDFSLTQEEIASRIGKARSTIANFLRLFYLPREIQEDLAHRRLTMGHAKSILMCSDRKAQFRLRNKILRESLTVRSAEGGGGRKTRPVSAAREQEVFYRALERGMEEKYLTKVRFIPEKIGGKIVITYSSNPDLDRIVELLLK